MGAIPIPDAAPAIALPNDDEQLRRLISQTGAQAEAVRPITLSNQGKPIVPQTPGRAIPINRATGAPEELNNQGKPIAPGIAGLWARAENIHNPFLRGLGKIGAVGARAIDVAGSVAAPGVMAQIPGTALNQKVEEATASRNRTADEKSALSEAQTANENAEVPLKAAQAHEAEARADALEDPQAKVGTPEAQAFSSLLTQVNPETQKPYTPIEAFEKVKQTAQDVKPDKTTPAHITYDQGIPVSVTSEKGQTFDVNDPKLPEELKPLVEAATRAHSQHESEAERRQARTFAQQEKMFEARQDALTTTTKDMVLAAPKVLALADRISKLVDSQAQQLGPAAGRWSEFMAGKVGSPNPEFTKLRTDVGLLQTLLMRMHVGSRGGEYIMHHFQDLIDTGKQSPENLKAALGEIVTYAHDVQAEGAAHGVGGGSNTPTTAADPLGILK